MFSYCSAIQAGLPAAAPGHIDPTIFESTYRGREVEQNFLVYALAGGRSITGSRSPQLHNRAFREAGIDALYLPFPSDSAAGFLEAIEAAGARGAAVTVPFKEEILPLLQSVSPDVAAIGACNTIRKTPTGWIGFNTDLYGFERSLLEFLGRERLDGVRATIIGAGGAAKSVAAVLHRIGASCLILNRSIAKAKAIAQRYGFIWGPIDDRSLELISEYDDLIIQSTSVGMDGGPHDAPGEILEWYEFRGHEAVYDLVYKPERSPLLQRAAAAGCRVCNGYAMLCYQAAEQFRIWMGGEPPAAYLPPQ
jgi:3-dehydroquinate dehydratase/shikimate dehydrogenase